MGYYEFLARSKGKPNPEWGGSGHKPRQHEFHSYCRKPIGSEAVWSNTRPAERSLASLCGNRWRHSDIHFLATWNHNEGEPDGPGLPRISGREGFSRSTRCSLWGIQVHA